MSNQPEPQCIFLAKDMKCHKQYTLFYNKPCPFYDHFDRCVKAVLNLKPIWQWKDFFPS